MASALIKRISAFTLLSGALVGTLVLGSPTLSASQPGQCQEASPAKRNVVALDVYRGLALSDAQRQSLNDLLAPYQDIRLEKKAGLDQLKKDMDVVYEKMETELEKGKDPKSKHKDALADLYGQIDPLRSELRTQSQETMEQLLGLLSDEQQTFVKGYHPAVSLGGLDAPPHRGKRRGPEGVESHGAERLEKLRTTDIDKLEKRSQHMAERAIENGADEAEANQRAALFLEIAKEIQTLSDEEWEESKMDYADRIKAEVLPPEGQRRQRGMKKGHHPQKGKQMKARILLSEEFLAAIQADL